MCPTLRSTWLPSSRESALSFGALLNTVPSGVLGGITVALYGLVGLIGIGNLTLTFGDLTFTGIALGTIAAVVIYHGMSTLARLRN